MGVSEPVYKRRVIALKDSNRIVVDHAWVSSTLTEGAREVILEVRGAFDGYIEATVVEVDHEATARRDAVRHEKERLEGTLGETLGGAWQAAYMDDGWYELYCPAAKNLTSKELASIQWKLPRRALFVTVDEYGDLVIRIGPAGEV